MLGERGGGEGRSCSGGGSRSRGSNFFKSGVNIIVRESTKVEGSCEVLRGNKRANILRDVARVSVVKLQLRNADRKRNNVSGDKWSNQGLVNPAKRLAAGKVCQQSSVVSVNGTLSGRLALGNNFGEEPILGSPK